MADVIALGDLLIDFTRQDDSKVENPVFVANPGGATANVAVALAQLGHKTAMIACVGKDAFGELLKITLHDKGVQTSGLVTSDIHTTLAFVHIEEDGERSFSFCRNPGADMMLAKENVQTDLILDASMLHIGSLSMTDNPAREATRLALNIAKENNKLISYDPNYRDMLWESEEQAKAYILEVMRVADIVKVSEEELAFLTGESTMEAGVKQVFEQYQVTLLFVTLGAQGSHCFHANGSSAFAEGVTVYAVDTTGCGDAFFAGVLSEIIENNYKIQDLTVEDLKDITRFGNVMGAYVATQMGAIPAMPARTQLQAFMNKGSVNK